MRTCVGCGTEMKENCTIKVEGAGYGIVMSYDGSKLFGGRIGKQFAEAQYDCKK